VLANSRFVASFVKKHKLTGDGRGAYLWNGNATGSSTPSNTYQYNSSGAPNHVTRLGTGYYRVELPDQAPPPRGGTVQVTAYGSGSDYCKISSWHPSGTEVRVYVRCFDTAGSVKDSRFTLFYTPTIPAGGFSGAHVWANNETSSHYLPHDYYEYAYIADDVGELNTPISASRSATGTYTIEFPSLSAAVRRVS
jgi:hypothetical protein